MRSKINPKYLKTVSTLAGIVITSMSYAQTITVTADGASATRGDSASLSCSATGGCPPYTYEWTSWTKGASTAKKTGASISAKILETCSVTVTATDANGATGTANPTITITARGWTVTHSTESDAWTDWGAYPLNIRGENINSSTGQGQPIIGEESGDWTDFVTRTQIDDSNGPFDDYWYNSGHSLRVERETRINQYLGGIVGGINWPSMQNAFFNTPGSYSPVISASSVRVGVVKHENEGAVPAVLSPKQGGHSALFKKKQDDASGNFNAARQIEKIYSTTSEDDLKNQDDSKIGNIDADLGIAGRDPLVGNYHSFIIVEAGKTPVEVDR